MQATGLPVNLPLLIQGHALFLAGNGLRLLFLTESDEECLLGVTFFGLGLGCMSDLPSLCQLRLPKCCRSADRLHANRGKRHAPDGVVGAI
jgi:hypothetical protein